MTPAEALGRLERALNDPGPAPEVHQRAVHELQAAWPALYLAVRDVLQSHGLPVRY